MKKTYVAISVTVLLLLFFAFAHQYWIGTLNIEGKSVTEAKSAKSNITVPATIDAHDLLKVVEDAPNPAAPSISSDSPAVNQAVNQAELGPQHLRHNNLHDRVRKDYMQQNKQTPEKYLNSGSSMRKDAKADDVYQLTDHEAKCYLENYPDLQGIFKTDLASAKQHWKTNGSKEGRNYYCEADLIKKAQSLDTELDPDLPAT